MLVLTQSTYDGIIYNAEEITQALDGHVDALHFDEAWLPHASFHELYSGMHAISDERARPRDTMIHATQSTHKLLAGISQASQVLVREAENKALDQTIFNESFLMHPSTSPQYSIIASCDVSAADRVSTEPADWWFDVWGPDYARARGHRCPRGMGAHDRSGVARLRADR